MKQENPIPLDKSFDEVYLKHYFRIVQNRFKLILFFTVATFAIVAIKTYTMTPIFRAYTEILIEENKPLSLFNQRTSYTPIDPTFLATQYEIIKSNGVLENVVTALQLDTKYKEHFLGKVVSEEELGYIAKFRLKLKTLKKELKTYLKKLLGREDPAKPPRERSATQNEGNTPEKAAIVDILAGNLTITPLTNTKIVRFVYTDKDPVMAARIANRFVDSYKSELMEIKVNNANYSLSWMKLKAEEERNKLATLENRMQKYARENNIVTVENRLTILPEKLNEYNTRLTEAKSKQQELLEINRQLETSGGNLEAMESIPLVANNPVLQNISSQLLDLDRRIAELSKKYGPKHPRMIETRNERSTLQSQKKKEINRIIQSAKKEYELAHEAEKNITEMFRQTKQETLLLNERLSEYNSMNRELETSRTLYDSLVQNMKEESARTQEKTVNVWVAKEAFTPKKPNKPKKKINLALALILGAASGLGLAFFLEYLDDTIKAPEDIERFNTPVLGVVEKVAAKTQKHKLFIDEGSFSTLSESYKIIRSSVLLSTPDNPPATILITSTEPGDGKSTTSVNFARSLSMLQEGKVLIVDCDLRKPRLHAYMGIKINREKSLSSYLAGITATHEEIILQRDELPFDVIAAGPLPPNPTELLASERMRSLLDSLKEQYTHIVLDSPPLFGAIDGLNLSTMVDGTILITRAEKTTKGLYSKVIQRLHSVNARVLGTIINAAVIKRGNLYHYAGYYSSYGEYGEKSDSGNHSV